MLTLVEKKEDKASAQRLLESTLKRKWTRSERRQIVWRPSSREMKIFHNGEFWFSSDKSASHDTTPRYWVPYGKYREHGGLQITVSGR